jgi:flagellar biosynthetic protein FlhB
MVDVPFQLWEHSKQLRMTKQEVKDENKETEGSPEVRGHVRRMQREISQQRMMEAVAEADVIVTNPTHYAVALKYDQTSMRAPVVVAKGADYIAQQIRNLGTINNIPVVSSPPLARSLFHCVKLNAEIPGGLYLAVAQLLAYVYQINEIVGRYTRKPDVPDFPIPDELRRDE